MTQVCTESGFPELTIGMTRSATTGHPSLFWSKHCQGASGAQQPREPGSLGSQGLWYSLFASGIEKRSFALSFFSASPFFNKFPSSVHSENLRDYSRTICLNVCDIRVKSLLKRERQKDGMVTLANAPKTRPRLSDVMRKLTIAPPQK